MNTARLATAVLAIGALTAGASYWRKGAVADSHRQARELVLRYTLARLDQPIVILGDSITDFGETVKEKFNDVVENVKGSFNRTKNSMS